MGKINLLENFDRTALADAKGGRGPLAHAVQRQKGRLGVGARKERGRRVRLMMAREIDLSLVAEFL